jgi:hypothetical protein
LLPRNDIALGLNILVVVFDFEWFIVMALRALRTDPVDWARLLIRLSMKHGFFDGLKVLLAGPNLRGKPFVLHL